MIFNFRIVTDEVDNFRREIQIDADATFLDLRNAIFDSVGYNKAQLCSFFLCDDSWEKEREITLEDMGFDASQDSYLMDETILSDEIEDEGQRLMLVFDYMTDRAFFIEMKKSITGKNLREPLCTSSMGTPPPQTIDIEEFDAKIDAKAAKAQRSDDIDEDFYGSDSYSDDEFEAGGFDEMEFDH
jgi:hypothetical protein